jgi:hypothetical protein
MHSLVPALELGPLRMCVNTASKIARLYLTLTTPLGMAFSGRSDTVESLLGVVNQAALKCCQLPVQYVEDVQCPMAFEASSKAAVLDWLLSYAISLEYQDQGEFIEHCYTSTASKHC